MGSVKSEFRLWLVDRLQWFEVDDEVYTDYIQSIIDDNHSDEPPSLIAEPILEFLSPAVTKDMTSFRENLTEWIVKLNQEKEEALNSNQLKPAPTLGDFGPILNDLQFTQESHKIKLSREEEKKKKIIA